MKPKLTSYRTILIRLNADSPTDADQERQVEQQMDQALDATLEEIRTFAAHKLLDLGQVSITTS